MSRPPSPHQHAPSAITMAGIAMEARVRIRVHKACAVQPIRKNTTQYRCSGFAKNGGNQPTSPAPTEDSQIGQSAVSAEKRHQLEIKVPAVQRKGLGRKSQRNGGKR